MKHIALALLLTGCTTDPATSTVEQASTVQADDLIVGQTATIGADLAAMNASLRLETSTEGTSPLEFMGLVPNTWDISPIAADTNGEARVTFFGNTPSQFPNLNYGGFEVRVRAGAQGEGGISLKPNGGSYFDPDHYAQKAKILALGHFRPKASLDIRDLANTHDSSGIDPASTFDVEGPTYELDDGHRSIRLLNAVGNSTINTGTTEEADYVAANLSVKGVRGTGTMPLHNVALRLSAELGDTNTAIDQDKGDNYFNHAGAGGNGGNSFFGANVSVVGKMTVQGSGTRFATATGGLYNLLIGSEVDGAYFVNGSLNYGWNQPAVDHLWINYAGYQGGFSRFGDVFFGNAKGERVAAIIGATKTLKADGPIEAAGPLGNSPTWTAGNGSPEGVVAAPVGSFYSRRDGAAGTSWYVKESGSGTTGWVAK